MAKKIVSRIDRNLARRLREARREAGLSVRAVAKKLPRRLALSHTTIASYENGVTVPPMNVLAAIADIYQRPITWFLDNRETLTGFQYRNLQSRVALSEQRQFEALAGKWADAYRNLDRHLNSSSHKGFKALPEQKDEFAPENLAMTIRSEYLNLEDNQPICNVVSVLESFSARALELRATFGVDGAAARLGGEYLVVINPEVANVRVRMNAAHELAYVLYGDCKQHLGWGANDVASNAYLFATTLLLPDSQLREAFEGRSFLKLIQYKEKFGISLAAMIYRAQNARIINTTASRWLWSQMAQRGWRRNEPGYVWRDRAITFEIMLESAVQSKRLAWDEVERITGVREEELRQRILDVVQCEGSRSNEEDVVSLKMERATDSA